MQHARRLEHCLCLLHRTEELRCSQNPFGVQSLMYVPPCLSQKLSNIYRENGELKLIVCAVVCSMVTRASLCLGKHS